MRILYITHYGILEPLGQSQILPYLSGLTKLGFRIEIVSFEKNSLLSRSDLVNSQTEDLASKGLSWNPLPYHEERSAGNLLAEIAHCTRTICRRNRKFNADLVHCRSHVPFLAGWLGKTFHHVPLLFDFRGFLAEEYVDSGLWTKEGAKYRFTKKLERVFVRESAAMVVLTKAAKDYLQKTYDLDLTKIFVIPCCVDQSKFHPCFGAQHAQPGRPLRVVYSGSTLGRYDMRAIFDFFGLLLARRPGSHLTILASNGTEATAAQARTARLPADSVSIYSLPYRLVPDALSAQDIGLFFLRGDLTLLVASPTKIGEYLASGLVVLAESRLGDIHEILVDTAAGCLIDSSTPGAWPAVLDQMLELCESADFRERASRVASRFYSLEEGISTYARVYEYAAARRPGSAR